MRADAAGRGADGTLAPAPSDGTAVPPHPRPPAGPASPRRAWPLAGAAPGCRAGQAAWAHVRR